MTLKEYLQTILNPSEVDDWLISTLEQIHQDFGGIHNEIVADLASKYNDTGIQFTKEQANTIVRLMNLQNKGTVSLTDFVAQHECDIIIGEVLSDYANYEDNLRPASTVREGIKIIAEMIDIIRQNTTASNTEIFEFLASRQEEYWAQDDVDDIIKQREYSMLFAAVYGIEHYADFGHRSTIFGSYEEMKSVMKRKLDGFK